MIVSKFYDTRLDEKAKQLTGEGCYGNKNNRLELATIIEILGVGNAYLLQINRPKFLEPVG